MALRRLRCNGWRIAHALGLSRPTVSRILRRNGMNRLASLDPPPPALGYEQKRPGTLIRFDIKRLSRIVKPGHRVHGDRTRETRGSGYQYLHIAIDDQRLHDDNFHRPHTSLKHTTPASRAGLNRNNLLSMHS